MDFSFYFPVKILFGRPLADALPKALETALRDSSRDPDSGSVLLISDPGLAGTGLVERVTERLHNDRWAVSLFTDVRSNPTVEDVELGLEVARANEVSALVALGGGSVIDVGKAIGLLMANGGTYADYQWHGRPITRPILPLVAVPTTAGTGSEVTKVAVIGDPETHFKKGVLSPYMFPRVAVVDPELTVTLPPRLTAATGADAFVHALEAFMGRRSNPITDSLATVALTRAWRFLPRATRDGHDLEARRQMALASTLAGAAFDQSGLGIIHSLAGPVAAQYDLHHGLCTALLLPHGLAYNLPGLGGKRATLLQALGMPPSASDPEVVCEVKAWVCQLGLPTSLGEAGICGPDLPAIAEEASHMVLLPNNPRPATASDCQRILEQAV